MKSKIYKLLSILLAVMIVFTSGTVAMIVQANSGTDGETKEYFVKLGATSGTGTEDAPFGNIGEAVSYAVDNNYADGDKVTITIIDDVTVDGADIIGWGTFPESYDFDLKVQTKAGSTAANVQLPTADCFVGDIEFANVQVSEATASWPNRKIILGGNNVILAGDTTLHADYTIFGTVDADSDYDARTFVIDGILAGYVYLSNEYGNVTYNGDVNVKISNNSYVPQITLSGNSGTTTYKNNINFDFTGKDSVTLRKTFNSGDFAVEGAVQILCSEGSVITGEEIFTETPPANGVYKIINASGINGLLEFTDTAGKYKTSDNDTVAVSKADSSEIRAEDGYLTLTEPGEYVVRIDRPAVVMDYYVSPEGISVTSGERPETAGTEENPVRTIADAIRLVAQDPLTSADIANIFVPNDKMVDWGTAAVKHSPTVVIQSINKPNAATVITSESLCLTGNTVFESINLMQQNANAPIALGHNNVVIDKNSSIESNYLIIGSSNSPGAVNVDQTIELYGKYAGYEFKLASDQGDTTYNNNINVIVDNPETGLNVKLGAASGTTTNYNGNIYINVKSAKGITFDNIAPDAVVNVGGTVQALVNKSVTVTSAVKEKFNKIKAVGGRWYITNYSSDPDLISFGNEIGTFNIKDNKKAYVRQYNVEEMDVFEGGLVTLDNGEYVISDEEIPYLAEELHRMLYFRNTGGLDDLYVRVPVTKGETYRFEYSFWSNRINETKPLVREAGDYRWTLVVPEIISEEVEENYYKVVCEATIPESYNWPSVFFGIELYPFVEGYLFDVAVYNEANEQIMPNNNLNSGLDHWAVGYKFWGLIGAGDRGGAGLLEFNGETAQLKVVDFSVDTIQELINLNDPDDGQWWKDDQIKEEELYKAYAEAVKGTLKDTEGKPIADHKILLVSSDNTYTTTTDSKGNFTFKDDILTGYYELYVETKKGKKIETGYATFIEEADVVNFDLVVSYNETQEEIDVEVSDQTTDYEPVVGDEETEEIAPSGSLSGTVYTNYLETVPDLKLYVEGVGEVVTDKNGNFAFGNVPVGEYSLYTVLSDGTKYEFRKVKIMENVKLKVKLKYDPVVPIDTDEPDSGWIIWVIVASVIALAVIVCLALFLVFKKKRA